MQEWIPETIGPDEFTTSIIDVFADELSVPIEISAPVLYMFEQPGKGLRPAIAFAVAEACAGEINDGVIAVAMAAEVLHAAALVHDDLVDDAELRRGRPALHRAFDSKTALLTGDYLMTAAQALLDDRGSERSVRLLGPALHRLAQAELYEFNLRGEAVTVETARSITAGKAGALFGWISAAVANECREWAGENAWYEWGVHLGVLFKLADDLAGHLGEDRGKRASDADTSPSLLEALLQTGGVSAVQNEIERLCGELERVPAGSPLLRKTIGGIQRRARERVAAFMAASSDG